MPDALETLAQINDQLNRLTEIVARPSSRSLTPPVVQPIVSAIARSYFGSLRPELTTSGVREGLTQEIDKRLQELIRLASASRERTAYDGLSHLSSLLLDATIELMKAKGEQRLALSLTEQDVLRRLAEMLPVSAESYEQALRDIAQGNRISWRGTATEMREVLREVIHHLAPTDQVTADPAYANEAGQTAPTQRQRVRFILAARRTPVEAIEQTEHALNTVDEMVAVLARTTYKRTNASTHGTTGAREVRNLQGYIGALLRELLIMT